MVADSCTGLFACLKSVQNKTCPSGVWQVLKNGRAGEIRTPDPLHPMQVRYQAALRPEPVNRLVKDGTWRGGRTLTPEGTGF